MTSMTLTKENASTLVFKCNKPAMYYKYEMVFLKNPINYAFQDPVSVKQCLYDVFVSQISENDQKTLNELFGRINENMTIDDIAFIKSKEENIKESKSTLISVEIIGFKKLDDLVKPIWKVKSIQKI